MLVVGDVHGLEHRLDAGARAPERNRKRNEQRYPEGSAALLGKPRQLLADDLDAAGRNQRRDDRDVLGNGPGIGKEPVDRNEGGERGKDGKQQKVGCAGRDERHAIVADLAPRPPQDVFPPLGRHLLRRSGGAAAMLLGRTICCLERVHGSSGCTRVEGPREAAPNGTHLVPHTALGR
jgi:hypothetical protein